MAKDLQSTLRKNAWVLDFGMGYRAAVGTRELFHLIDVPTSYIVPCTPAYCRSVLFWQGKLLPMMDMSSRVGGAELDAPYIAVVGYQSKRGELPQFGALKMVSPPLQVTVSDEHACEIPDELRGWRELSISCFDLNSAAIPILNLKRIFNTAPI